MRTTLFLSALLIALGVQAQPQADYSQPVGKAKLRGDYDFFRRVRNQTNSGLFKYRSPKEIDSVYNWGYQQIRDSTSLIEFYRIILVVTDFEGSTHNNTALPSKALNQINTQASGFFPLPVAYIQGKLVINTQFSTIPLGAELIQLNGMPIDEILNRLHKYYTTDGFNLSGKYESLKQRFSRSYWYEFGPMDTFSIAYRLPNDPIMRMSQVDGTTWAEVQRQLSTRHSAVLDSLLSDDAAQKYQFEILNPHTARLTVRTFAIGDNAKDAEHKEYVAFLERSFGYLRQHAEVSNLIVDVRGNGGGSDPNDQVTFSYLAQKPFQENTSAFVTFQRIPAWKYVTYDAFFLIRPIAKWVFQRQLRKEFPHAQEGRFYARSGPDNTPRQPNPLAFRGQVYLLINPPVASAGSMFAAQVRGNTSSIVVGEETEGGYYGHNGHQPIGYRLPHTGIRTFYSIVNLEQDAPVRADQPRGRGVLPDTAISQSYADFITNRDTQLQYILTLIERKAASSDE
jgi:hypothetical protein